jgi:hypothetical protein
MTKVLLAICCILIAPVFVWGQNKDSLVVKDTSGTVVAPKPVEKANVNTDTTKKVYSPRKAAIYSAIMPGLGQIYNKKYWKVPIVYAAVGIPIYLFFDNKKWYNKVRFAAAVASNQGTPDPDDLAKVDPKLIDFVNNKNVNDLLTYRNEFRKDMDYAILFTLLFWACGRRNSRCAPERF